MSGRHTLLCLLAVTAAATSAALAEPMIEYRIEWLTAAQREKLDKQVENYAMVESFLNTCGPPPRFESRVRSAAAGCIAKESLDAVALRFRNLTAASMARATWRCGDADVVQFAKKMRRILDLTIGDIIAACKKGGPPPEGLSR